MGCNGHTGTKEYANVKLPFLILSLICTLNNVESTISIISDKTGDTVFSVEEAGVDTTSGFNLEGRLVISSPLNACQPVSPPPTDVVLPPKKWVLISTVQEAGEEPCSLSRKAKHAQGAGYSGIIFKHVGSNDTDGVLPRFIGLDWIGVTIYACVVGDDIGTFLMEKYVFPDSYYLRFENEPHWPIGLLANFVIIGFLGILCVLLLLRLFYYLYYRVTRSVVQRRRLRKALLSEKQLRKLPILKWTSSIPQDTCSICIEQFVFDEEIRVLPCSHVFHKVCIDPWLSKESRKCPNCKRRVLFPNERFSFSSDDSVESDTGDEQTPLLRHNRRRRSSDENYRFVETLTESHNSRVLSHQNYDEIPGSSQSQQLSAGPVNTWSTTSRKPSIETDRTNVPKVTFAPTRTIRSGNSNSNLSSQVSTKAFVLPSVVLGHRPKLPPINPTRTFRPDRKPPATSLAAPIAVASSSSVNTKQVAADVENLSDDNHLSTEDSQLEFHDVQPNDANTSSLSDSAEIQSLSSFHSCQGFLESNDLGEENQK